MSIGKRLRKARLERGLTQTELAEPHYTHSFVSAIEAGRREPSPAALEHFAAKLGAKVEELRDGRPSGLETRLAMEIQAARVELSHGDVGRAEGAYNTARRQAHRFQLSVLEARAVEGLARCAEQSGDLETALARFEEADALLRGESPVTRAAIVAGKVRCLNLRGDKRYAIHVGESLIETLERDKLRDPAALVVLHSAVVVPYVQLGLQREAARHAEIALALSGKVDDAYTLATMNVQVGRLLFERGEFDAADESFLRAADLFRQQDMRTETAMAQLASGWAYIREGRTEEARVQLEAAATTFKDVARPVDEARALNELASIEREAGDSSRAQELLHRAIELLGEKDTAELALSHRELGLAFGPESPDEAEKNLNRALELYELAGERVEVALTYGAIGDLQRELGNGEGGCDSYRQGIMSLLPQ